MRHSIFFVLVVASLESGCGAKLPSLKPFKMEVQQGNVVTSKMLLQLRPGMTRAQVRYIMGTPLIVDSFRDNRWDYFYELRKQGVLVEKRRVILDFDQDSLVSVRGDVVPSADNPDVKSLADTPTKKVEAEGHWTEKLKFWHTDSATTTAPPAAVQSEIAAPATVAEPAPAGKPESAAVVEGAPATVEAPAVASGTAQTGEVIPYIPEGEYQQAQAPSQAEMVKGNSAETATPVEPAATRQVTEKGTAAVSEPSPPVFEATSAPIPEPAPVIPAPAPVASKPDASVAVAAASVAASATKPAAEGEVVPYIPEGEYADVAAASPGVAPPKTTSAVPAPVKAQAAPLAAAVASKPAAQSVAEARPVAQPEVKEMKPPVATAQDEVVPYIPEGEYQGPGPTLQQMMMGNDEESGSQAVEASTQSITEKGVAPVAAAAAAQSVFVAEQLPAEQAEEVLPPPPPSVKAPVAPVTQPSAPVRAAESSLATASATSTQQSITAPVVAAAAVAGDATTATDADVNAAVASWAQAWRGKDITAYLAAYATDFVPEDLPSKKAWEAQRKQRLSPAQGTITLVLKNVQVQRNGNIATVQFEQKYATKAYRDEVVKTLQLRYAATEKRWLITRERTGAATGMVASIATLPQAATPATVASAERPVPAVAVTPVASVDAAVQAWAQAWRSKNVQGYLAAYAPDFIPEGLPSRKAWESQRKQRLSGKQGDISLELNHVNVQQDGNEATVTFNQKYASRVYRDEMMKQLQLRYEPAQQAWLIIREQSVSGAATPVARKTVTAPEGTAEHLDGVLEQIGF